MVSNLIVAHPFRYFISAGKCPTDIAKTHIIFQLLSICHDRVKLENQLRDIKKEKRNQDEKRERIKDTQLKKSHIRKTSSSVQSSKDTIFDNTSCSGVSDTTGGDECSSVTSTSSGDEDSDTDIFEQDNNKPDDEFRSNSFSAPKVEVFNNFRRHSFRVGYFADEDEMKTEKKN